MKKISGAIVLAFLALACQKNEAVSEFTGNETTYSLQPGSQFAVSGTVVFKERKDGKISATIALKGTSGDAQFPVHLHMGDITTPAADIALLMNPVAGKSGTSETTFDRLADESVINYSRLTSLQACVKIHLGDTGADRDVILAAGNIGAAVANSNSGGRLGVSVCKSE
ncbi:MAG TPA: hypothetical protein VG737_00920 [Cyclobacteriaceae bacterium]|nr:hypothetical protein [Cyclobacteriaceae bacterium]